jgi:flagellar FliL protein
MAGPKKNETEEGGGGKKKLIIIIAAVLIILIGGGGGAFILLKAPPSEEEPANEQVAMLSPEEIDPSVIGPMVDISEFIVNIISEDGTHFVKTAMSLELTNDIVMEEANKRMPQIRDAIILLLGNKTFEELQDIHGKKQIKAEIESKINSFLTTGQVRNVFLTDFIVRAIYYL